MTTVDHLAEAERRAVHAASPEAENAYEVQKSLAIGQLHAAISMAQSLAAIVGTDDQVDAAVAALASLPVVALPPEPTHLPDLDSPEAYRFAERVIRHTWRCGPGTRSQRFAQELADRAASAEEVEL
ncbi:hypothetical protein KXR83_05635 [Williamsia muralis]|uniref:hypothetical protein n=1 Tax=Williamsia marianensis TaxID=85044 RepID=UPI003F17B559